LPKNIEFFVKKAANNALHMDCSLSFATSEL